MKRLILLFVLFFFLNHPILAQDSSSRYEELSKQIQELERQLAETQAREKTLSSQISYMNNQIKLTTLKISETEAKIDQLGEEIESLSAKIDRLEESLGHLSEVLLVRIVETYKQGNVQAFHLLFSSNGFSDFLTRLKYIKIVQAHDKKLMFQMQETKDNYSDQKQVREEKKKEQERLKRQLETQKIQLAQQMKDKQSLLEITRNDERRYQELLAAARAEIAAIEKAVLTIQLKDGTPVKEGEAIAVLGNTGAPYCSTGPHLHFELRKNGKVEDPNNYLKAGISFEYNYPPVEYNYYGTISPRGSWNWPLNEPIKINQGYGSHGFAKVFYLDGFHNGIDMNAGLPLIKAPKDGTLYKGSISCRGVGMNFVAIDHGDGLISWYWHVQ